MDREQKALHQEVTHFLGFEVWHYSNKYIIGGHEFMLGECVADILNLDIELLDKAHAKILDIARDSKYITSVDMEFIARIQNAVNEFVNVLFTALPYRVLPYNRAWFDEMFTKFYRQRNILSKRFDNSDKQILSDFSKKLFAFRFDVERIQMLYTDLLDNYVWAGQTQVMAETYERFHDDIYDEKNPKNYTDKSKRTHLGSKLLNFSMPVVIDFGIPPKGSSAPGICEVITFMSLFDFARWEISQSMIAGNLIKRCKCCGKFFAMEPGYFYEYCSDIAPDESVRTCREVGALKSHEEKIKNDPVWAAYRKAYKKYHARVGKGKMSKSEFQIWADGAIVLRDRALSGEVSVGELREQLVWNITNCRQKFS